MVFANQISCCDGGIHDGTANAANTSGLSLLENVTWYSENGRKGEPCSRVQVVNIEGAVASGAITYVV